MLSSGSVTLSLAAGVHRITIRDAGFDGHSPSEIESQQMCGADYTVTGTLSASTGTFASACTGVTLEDKASMLAKAVRSDPYLWAGKGWDWKQAGGPKQYLAVEAVGQDYWYYLSNPASNPCVTPPPSTDHLYQGKGLDCAGLVMWAYNKAYGTSGYQMDPVTHAPNPIYYEGADGQYRLNSSAVNEGDLRPGDLLFFDWPPQDGHIDHVAMYVGGDDSAHNVVEASTCVSGIIFSSKDTLSQEDGFVGYRRRTDPKIGTKIIAHSPVSLAVTDPDGFFIGPDTVTATDEEELREVPGILYYSTWDIDDDERLDDMVTSPDLKAGVYVVVVIPKPAAQPTDTYTVEMEAAGRVVTLAQDARIQDIPSQGFRVRSTGTDILLDHPPVAEAGSDQILECQTNLQATATLDGSTSTDSDSTPGTNDDIATFGWSEGSSPLASGEMVSVPLHLGVHEVALMVTDEAWATATDDVVVTVRDTTPPNIACPTSVTVECQSTGEAQVSLPLATASDSCYGNASILNDHTPNGADASGSYPLGRTALTFTATDGSGLHASCQTAVTVVDTVPPMVTEASSNPSVLWPPNHTMRDVALGYTANDMCSITTCTLTVTSNEPLDGTGDGDTAPDWVVLDDHHVQLRAERAGTGNQRTYNTQITCADASGNPAMAGAAVLVKHDMNSPKSGAAFKIGTAVNFAGSFSDVPGKIHTAQWILDSIVAPGTVTEPTSTKPGTVKGTYTFSAAGVYAVKMNVSDSSGATGIADAVGGVNALVVVYDPNGGFVSGGGWLDSAAGAYVADRTLTGKANFGFVSKYFKSATNPKGETEFDFRTGNFNFNSLNFDYLVISGAKAQYKGAGKVNGDGGYSFILTAIDGQATGGGGVDKIRMKIWNKSTGAIVYDNQMGAADNADPITPLGEGSSIVIQR